MNMSKYAIVTGVSSGIGECIADCFIKEGIYVFGVDENIPKNSKIDFLNFDIRDEEKIISIINSIKEKTDSIDYLINCAGIFCDKRKRFNWKSFKRRMAKCYWCQFNRYIFDNKVFYTFIKKSSNGNIINFSSEQVVLPQLKSAPYAITKAGIEMFSKILAFELMENKIRVNTIALASVKTNFLKRYKKDANIINEMMEKTDKNMPFGIIKPNDVYELVKYWQKRGIK